MRQQQERRHYQCEKSWFAIKIGLLAMNFQNKMYLLVRQWKVERRRSQQQSREGHKYESFDCLVIEGGIDTKCGNRVSGRGMVRVRFRMIQDTENKGEEGRRFNAMIHSNDGGNRRVFRPVGDT